MNKKRRIIKYFTIYWVYNGDNLTLVSRIKCKMQFI